MKLRREMGEGRWGGLGRIRRVKARAVEGFGEGKKLDWGRGH